VNDCVDSPLVRGVKAATIGIWPVDASPKGITKTEAAGAHKVCTIVTLAPAASSSPAWQKSQSASNMAATVGTT
jgi:hypothetical protein